MGLFNFLKRAGKSLGLGADEAPTPEMLQKEVADLGLDAKGAEITVEGDKVTVSGGSLSAEEREKLILAVGNVEGVATVEAALDHHDERGVRFEDLTVDHVIDADRLGREAADRVPSGVRA